MAARVPITARLAVVALLATVWRDVVAVQVEIVLASDLDRPEGQIRTKRMNPTPLLVIHEVLPREILEMVFEEHAKLEWRAPATDGRVCRLWRQIVLNTPRAWGYLEFSSKKPPKISKLLMWLDRSREAPLHIRVDQNFTLNDRINDQTLYDFLGHYHTRIESLRMTVGDLPLFEGRDFPCMRLLDVERWSWRSSFYPPVQWVPMPELQSLRLGQTKNVGLVLNDLPPLKMLALYINRSISLSRHSVSLMTLMLHSVSVEDVISGSVDFPSLTYLSLYRVRGLKSYINAPYLVTYHEGGYTVRESFPAPVPSLVEYGVYGLRSHYSDPTEWHRSFPNILRLAIRADPPLLISFLDSLSGHPQSLPALQMISAYFARMWSATFSEEDEEVMKSLVRVRSEACHMDITLHLELPFRIPLFFGHVSHCPIRLFVIF